MTEDNKIDLAMEFIKKELTRATKMHGPFNSPHEGLSVIWEEFEELKEEVWLKTSERDPDHMLEESVQLAAMALKFAVCLLPNECFDRYVPKV